VALAESSARSLAELRGVSQIGVLARTDSSPEAESACRSALQMLGSRLGRPTLATVVDYDVAVGSGLAEENERAMTGLSGTANATELRPETLLLSGRPLKCSASMRWKRSTI
jgi:hypothetical protein